MSFSMLRFFRVETGGPTNGERKGSAKHSFKFFFMPAAIAFLGAFAGCFSVAPREHGLAFSPDGKKIAYVDRDLKGIVLKNLETGEYRELHRSQKDFSVAGLFWPEEDSIHFVEMAEEETGVCTEDKDDLAEELVVYLKKIDPETLKKEAVWKDKVQISCLDDTSPLKDRWFALALGSVFLSTLNYDREKEVVHWGGVPFPGDKKIFTGKTHSALPELIREAETGDITWAEFSPDKTRIAYLQLEGFRILDEKPLEKISLKIVERNEWKIKEIFFWMDLSDMPGIIKWTRDGSSLVWTQDDKGKQRLHRYDLDRDKVFVLLDESVVDFALFPSDDRALAFIDRGGSIVGAIIGSEGKVENYFAPIVTPPVNEDVSDFPSLTVDPTGRYAASFVQMTSYGYVETPENEWLEDNMPEDEWIEDHLQGGEWMEDVFICPILYDLKEGREEVLVYQEQDNIAVGDLYFQKEEYGEAAKYYAKAMGRKARVKEYGAWFWAREADWADRVREGLLKELEAEGINSHLGLGDLISSTIGYELADREYELARESLGWKKWLEIGRERSEHKILKSAEAYEKGIAMFKERADAMKSGARVGFEPTPSDWEDFMKEAISAPLEGIEAAGRRGLLLDLMATTQMVQPEAASSRPFSWPFLLGRLHEASGDCKAAKADFQLVIDRHDKNRRKWKDNPEVSDYVGAAEEKIKALKSECGAP